jgi:hypothetical protein
VRTHPYNRCEGIPDGTKHLIVGTCPPPRFERPSEAGCKRPDDFDFYYGSDDNQMWSSVLPGIFGGEFPKQMGERRDFLKHKKIWMQDILDKYRRRANTPNDNDLEPVCLLNLMEIFRRYRELDTLICTGRRAEKWTRQRMVDQELIKDGAWPVKTEFGQCYQLTLTIDGNCRSVSVCIWLSPVRRTAGRNKKNTELYRRLLVQECDRVGFAQR